MLNKSELLNFNLHLQSVMLCAVFWVWSFHWYSYMAVILHLSKRKISKGWPLFCCDRDVFRGCQCLNLSFNHLVPHYNLPFISATPFLCSFFTLLFQAFVSLPLSSLLLVSFWTKTASVYTTASIQQTDHSAAFPFPIRFYVTKEDICVSWRPDLCTDNSSISFYLLVHFEIIPTFFHTALFLAALWFWLYSLIPSHLFNITIKWERSLGNKLYTLYYIFLMMSAHI